MKCEKKPVQRYASIYMSLGMCFGVSGGLVYGMVFYPENMNLGMCFGIPIGMCIGYALGSTKDKRLSQNIMEISKIEAVQDSSDMVIYTTNKNGVEKKYQISSKKMREDNFSVGNRVVEEADGLLISLESNS